MSDPRGKRVLFMSISAAPAHRDQSFEVSICLFYTLSTPRRDHKLIAFHILLFRHLRTPFRFPFAHKCLSSVIGITDCRLHQVVHEHRSTSRSSPSRTGRSNRKGKSGIAIVVPAARRLGEDVWRRNFSGANDLFFSS